MRESLHKCLPPLQISFLNDLLIMKRSYDDVPCRIPFERTFNVLYSVGIAEFKKCKFTILTATYGAFGVCSMFKCLGFMNAKISEDSVDDICYSVTKLAKFPLAHLPNVRQQNATLLGQ